MREVSIAEVLDCLNRYCRAGFHVDERLRSQVTQPGTMFMMSLTTTEDFLKLVWQSIRRGRWLR